MSTQVIMLWYVALLLLQMLHILEEIALEAYKVAGSLKKYLLAASVIVTLNYVPLFMMVFDLRLGYVLACAGALLGIGNGIIHLVAYLRTRRVRGTVGAGVFTGIPLGLVGGTVLYSLIRFLLSA